MIIAGLAMVFRGKFWEGWESWESWESREHWEDWESWEHCGGSCCHRLCAAFLSFYFFTFISVFRACCSVSSRPR